MFTNALRILLAKQIKPFQFVSQRDYFPDLKNEETGIYVHIPFCKSICSFCPYYKTLYESNQSQQYLKALLKEISMSASRINHQKLKINSIYFGGGSPSLMSEYLKIIIDTVKENFDFDGDIGVELHPQDVNPFNLTILKYSGVNMISLGAQSFRREQLKVLGRERIDPARSLKMIAGYDFDLIDVDLIFGIPGQSASNLKEDFITAVQLGATQVSTYPFIDFTYAQNLKKPAKRSGKKQMLKTLLETSVSEGFERTSVWTFAKRGTPQYSSITRDHFIGFGPSATSLGPRDFKINTFSVDEYIKTLAADQIPSALRLKFNPRTRGLYWLFWSCYTGRISSKKYKNLFDRDLKKDFGVYLQLAKLLGLVIKEGDLWTMTEQGSYLFHLVEQQYTRQYIDKTWRLSLIEPWPKAIKLY